MRAMLKHCLRRFGLWPVVAGVTLISILVSMAIVAAVHRFILGEPLVPAAVWLGIVCPLVLAPMMSTGSFALLLKLDRAHERLRELAETDYLTGAHNRRYFMERLNEEAERMARGGLAFTVALIDVDNFKAVNDRHGHAAGDEVLCRLARLCRADLRSLDTFARFGGEEFAVLLPQTDMEQARQWLDRMRQQIAQLRIELPPDSLLHVTVSIGAACPRSATALAAAQVASVLRLADEALYRAKREGKNRVALPLPAVA
jgi:diguanylate cyclase (GGDEF)-like protein